MAKENKEEIKVKLKENSYSVIVQWNTLASSGKHIKQLNLGKKVLLVSQNKIPSKYIQAVKKSLVKEGYKVFVYLLPVGEKYKSINSLLKIVNYAIQNRFERNDSFCAIGGGVISDLTGLAASVYYRGVNFLCIPTTLLGMVDASIGGKTAVNLKKGKNLIGTFYQPKIVLVDPATLKTLPKREFLVGMGEVLKYALIERTANCKFSSGSFFRFLKNKKSKILNLSQKELLGVICYSAYVKAKIVSKDERESNLRAILNLGHTFGHGIEQAYDYKKYTHGEAVSIGIALASKLAVNEKLINKTVMNSIIGLVKSYNMPTSISDTSKVNKIIKAMLLDKKNRNGRMRFVLPSQKIGNVKIVSDIPVEKIKPLFLSR